MGSMNKAMKPEQVMQNMRQFEMESEKMAMKEELSEYIYSWS